MHALGLVCLFLSLFPATRNMVVRSQPLWISSFWNRTNQERSARGFYIKEQKGPGRSECFKVFLNSSKLLVAVLLEGKKNLEKPELFLLWCSDPQSPKAPGWPAGALF